MAGNPKFGKRVRDLREAKKAVDPEFSLRRFAQAVGISATFMSKVENGEFDPPAVDKIKRMAQLLEVDPDELLALGGRIDPELPEIIREQPKAMADFLRASRNMGLGSNELKALTRMIQDYGPVRAEPERESQS